MPGPLQLISPIARRVLGPVFRPLTRSIATIVAIPAFRYFLRKVLRVESLDEETEKDLVEWFKGSVLLLFSTRNVEAILVGLFRAIDPNIPDVVLVSNGSLNWYITGGRLLLAIAAIESMPDQQLFAIIHPGPPKPVYDRQKGWRQCVREQWRPILRGLACQHLNRSSPTLAIMAVIIPGTVGWVCFTLAAIQYLIIGLVTSRDRAIDVLTAFDRRVEQKRAEIIEEFHITPDDTKAPIPGRIASPDHQRADPLPDF